MDHVQFPISLRSNYLYLIPFILETVQNRPLIAIEDEQTRSISVSFDDLERLDVRDTIFLADFHTYARTD